MFVIVQNVLVVVTTEKEISRQLSILPQGGVTQVSFTLTDSPATKELWPHAFELRYDVQLKADSLTTTLQVKNTGDSSFDFQTLLHTYLRVPDINEAIVEGLKGILYADKVAGGDGHEEDRSAVDFKGEVDRVYTHPDETKGVEEAVLKKGGDKATTVKLTATGADKPVPCDVVVWNPWIDKAKALSDMADEEYKCFVCVEPGLVSKQHSLGAGETATLGQTISAQ